jgi:4-carboxymuconolactone decarboxylase
LADLQSVAPEFVKLSREVVFDDLWRRRDLRLRDRSLVTIAALAAMGDAELLEPYLRRGIESGLKREEIAQALTQLAFYAGWAKSTKALTEVSRVLGDTPAP